MTDQHPITPPPELVVQWLEESPEDNELGISGYIATQAARWGADQELEACEKYWMTHGISPEGVVRMREARRPKPLSLKEQALEVLKRSCFVNQEDETIIRHALEQLDD